MQLKDITRKWIYEQLRAKYEEFEYINISSFSSGSGNWSLMQSNTSSGAVAYISKYVDIDELEDFALLLKHENRQDVKDAIQYIHELWSTLYNQEVRAGRATSNELREMLCSYNISYTIHALREFLQSAYDHRISTCYPKFEQLDDSTLRLTIIQHSKISGTQTQERVTLTLITLKEELELLRQRAIDMQLKYAPELYTEGLAHFDTLNSYVLNRLRVIDLQEFLQKELHVYDFHIDDPEFSETVTTFDNVPKLTMFEYLDPMLIKRLIAKPKQLIDKLTDLCNITIAGTVDSNNEVQSNVISLQDALESGYIYLDSCDQISSTRTLTEKLNDRIKAAEPRSKEKQVLRKFKESIKLYLDQFIKEYHETFPYIVSENRGQSAKLVADAIILDFKNNTNKEKLRIIDELTVIVQSLEQSAKSINSAYHDMLANAYSE